MIISSMGPGGAERIMSLMGNYWSSKGWDIILITFDNGNIPSFYNLDSNIEYINIGTAYSTTNFFKKIYKNIICIYTLRKYLKKYNPNAIVSFIDKTNIKTLMSSIGINTHIIVSERTNPELHKINIIWKKLRRIIYNRASYIVVQTKSASYYFSKNLQNKIAIIPNPVIDQKNNELITNKNKFSPCIIAMGRLDKNKGFDILLKAFFQLKDRYPNWNLTILGDGPSRVELETLRRSLGLSHRVIFPGTIKNPSGPLKSADLFVMPSRYEGFPNALCEAMACGLPVIASDCPSGPREIISDGIDGILVPPGDVVSLTAAMDRLMSDESERRRLGLTALKITERFSLERVMGMWERLIERGVE